MTRTLQEGEPPFDGRNTKTYFVRVLAAIDVGFDEEPSEEEFRDALLDNLVDQIQQRVISGDGIEIEYSHEDREDRPRDPYEVYGTPEHEALLIAEERGERW